MHGASFLGRFSLWFVVGLTVSLLIGCSEQPTAVRFNNQLTSTNGRLQQAHQEFFDAINTVRESGATSIKPAADAYRRLTETLQEVKAETKLAAPPQSQKAQAFQAAQLEYFETQEKIIADDYREILEVLAKADINSLEKERRIAPLRERAVQADAESLQPLLDAQQAFAAEYGLSLVEANQ